MNRLNLILIVGTLIISGCASAPTAQLASGNPNEAIKEVESLRNSAKENQIDLLAKSLFLKGESRLEEARNGLQNSDTKDSVLRQLSESKAYFQEATEAAKLKGAVPERVLAARKATLKNGVRESQELRKRLDTIDESLRGKTNSFTKNLLVEEVSQFEKDYLKLEILSVQNAKLLVFRDIVKKAESNDAPDLAPKSFSNAKNDLRAAENMIQQSPRNPENYRDSVEKSDKSAKLLSDVMDKLKGVAVGASEDAALQLVYQERKLGLLSDRASHLEGSLSQSEGNLNRVSGELQDKTEEARNASNKVRLQGAMDQVRSLFASEEAEVYQQGSSLIIRLKEIGFKTGSAMIPSESMNLLSKVNSIIEPLNPASIVIQGHTDSIGKSGNNQILSMKRSEAVARYFKSLKVPYEISSKGYGESAPITSNDTKEGRAINRRVDIEVNTNNPI